MYLNNIMYAKQEVFAICLIKLKDALDSGKYKFWLACGTALGAYRENKFIEHEGDIDIAMFVESYNQNLIPHMTKHGFKFGQQLGTLKNGMEMSFVYQKLRRFHKDVPKIDIFFIYKKNNYWWRSSFGAKNWKNVYFKKEIPVPYVTKYAPFNLVEIDFLDRKYLIPDVTYIEQLYGPNWRYTDKKYSHNNLAPLRDLEKMPFRTLSHNWENNITILIKTFLRPKCLIKSVETIRLFYPNIKIIIADDSTPQIKKLNQDNLSKYKVSFIDLPFDS